MASIRSRKVATLVALVAMVGCGEGEGDGIDVDVSGEIYSEEQLEAEAEAEASRFVTLDDLREAALAYTAYWAEQGANQGPADVEDLVPYLSTQPRVVELIRRGDIIVCWEASMRDLPKGAERTVLAYGRRAPVHGGPVAFADSSTRMVRSYEFSDLPQASASR